jgi:MYXO-CTERM domain-containing protein
VLAEIMRRYPPKASRFFVLDAPRLKIRYRISLPGYFGVDAISPDGRWLYLIHYKDSGGANYDVRVYDMQRGRLLARPIVDPREPDEKMQGIPMTRVQSPDGRWAYTLYAADQPFIHALDTVGRTAVCIDLPQALANAPGEAKLTLHGGTLAIAQRGAPVAAVDLRTYKVRPAASAPPARARATATSTPASASDGGGVPWIVWLLPLAAFAALAGVLRRRHATAARAPAPPDEIVVNHRHDARV